MRAYLHQALQHPQCSMLSRLFPMGSSARLLCGNSNCSYVCIALHLGWWDPLSCCNYRASPSPGVEKVTKSCISQRAKMGTRPCNLNWTLWRGFVLTWLSKKCTLTARKWFGSSNSRRRTCLSSFFFNFVIMGKRVLSKLIDRYRTGKTKILQNAGINLHICFVLNIF